MPVRGKNKIREQKRFSFLAHKDQKVKPVSTVGPFENSIFSSQSGQNCIHISGISAILQLNKRKSYGPGTPHAII